MSFTPIKYVKFQRVTAEEMNYIQTQYKSAEKLKTVSALPSTATAGEVVFLTTDGKFYGYDGSEWGSIGDVELPILDDVPLLRNATNISKNARFDLSLISDGTSRVYSLPDGNGVLALLSEVPVITGGIEQSVLSLGTAVGDIKANPDVLIGREAYPNDSYIEINKSIAHTGDVIVYNDGINNPRFVVKSDGRTAVKKLTVFNGGDG